MGDEYTPTDQDMRDHIVWMAPDGKEEAHLGAFNRWLAEHDATVLESARNRLNGHDPAGEQLQRMADEKRADRG